MPPTEFELPVVEVSAVEIRRIFNEGRYFERVQSGELKAIRKRNGHPQKPIGDEPICTHSQTWYYLTQDDKLVAVIHQYLRPDGTLGLSGRPDPKRMYLDDRIIYVPTKPSQSVDR